MSKILSDVSKDARLHIGSLNWVVCNRLLTLGMDGNLAGFDDLLQEVGFTNTLVHNVSAGRLQILSVFFIDGAGLTENVYVCGEWVS